MRFLKKAISLLASSFLVLILSGFLSLRPIANPPALAAVIFPNNACRDITKAAAKNFTDPVPAPLASGRKEGVADSGQMDFDQPADFQACVSTDRATRTLAVQLQNGQLWEGEVKDATFLKGWVWNTNLGDISFSCENGLNGEGAECGNINYGTYLKGSELHGFAYGDKIGWISMGCRNQKNVVPADLIAVGSECGDKAYGVYAASAEQVGQTEQDCAIASAGDLYGYAWTESVGWINFCGSHLDVTPSGISLDVAFEAKPSGGDGGGGGAGGGDAGAGVEAAGENVYANGSDSYKIIIKATENGAPLPDQAAYTAHNIAVNSIEWDNKLRADQVTTCAGAACVYNGAILPTAPGGFAWDAAEQALVGEVKAIAPTLGADTLVLKEITVNVDGVGQILTPEGETYNFIFKPAVSVSQILGADAAGNPVENDITALNNTSQEVRIIAKKTEINAGAIQLINQLYNCSVGQYDFVFDDGQGNVKNEEGTAIDENQFIPPESLGTFPNIQRQGICVGLEPDEQKLDDADIQDIPFVQNGTAEIRTFIFAAPPEGSAPDFETTNALALQPIIAYELNNVLVSYFSEKTLRAGVLNQAASVTGNVNISIVNTEGLRSDISKSLGDRAQSRREAYYRAVKIVLGQRAPDAFDQGGSDEKNLTADNAFGNKDILYYVRPQGQIPEKPCKIIINDLTLDSNKTLVTDGCDIFIDSNINPQNASLGIIAMEDMTKEDEPKGGNIYICNGVTDIKTHIIADGSILSYGKNEAGTCQTKDASVIDPNTGVPIYSLGVRVLLRNQLAIEGSMVTNNTYGGSLQNPMLTCNGEQADNPEEKQAARFCDINFLRYAKTEPHPNDPTRTCWADDVTTSALLGPTNAPEACNAGNFPRTGNTGKGIVNIIYKTPPKDLPIFNKVK